MRKVKSARKTNETAIAVELNLDGNGVYSIDTGVGFFDHMLELFSAHSGFDLTVSCKGDINVDAHHTVEDVGIVLGKLIAQALGDKCGITRFATFYVPMDESLVRTVIDLSGRPYLCYKAELIGKVGNFDAELAEEFFRAICNNALINAHIQVIERGNNHHMIEAMFKSFARALAAAVRISGTAIPSSKGIL